MPAQGRNTVSNFQEFITGSEIYQSLHEVETSSAHACLMHFLQFGITNCPLDRCHPPRSSLGMLKCINHRSIIATVTAGLDDHVLVKTQVVSQSEQLRFGCIAGCVFSLSSIGKFCTWSKHMTVRINRTRWQRKMGFGWCGIKWQPPRSNFEFH